MTAYKFVAGIQPTATNRYSSGAQHTLLQVLSAADVRIVHVIPSGLVMTLFPVPFSETATNKYNSGDQHTDRQELSAADVRVIQFTPSELVITLFPVPPIETATNKDNSDAQQIDMGCKFDGIIE